MAGVIIREDGFIADGRGFLSHGGLANAIATHSSSSYVQVLLDRVFAERGPDLYERVTTDADHIAPLDAEDVLPEGGQQKVIVIAAHKGMGKSKAIRASLLRLPPGTTVLNVTFRRVLARGEAANIPGGATYLDEDVHMRFGPGTHPALTIVINSLWRVDGTYDVVILDELVSILEMLAGELLDGAMRMRILEALVRLIEEARVVIVADALLDELSLRVVADVLCADARVKAIHYTHCNHADHAYVHYSKFSAWHRELMARVKAGSRVVVPALTRAFALRIEKEVQMAAPGARVLTYVADSDHDMEAHMRDIHDHWKVDVLIYSPVITAGCSFEERAHFDECFLYAFQGTASVRSAIQMTFRVRDLARRRIHVFVDRAGRWVPEPPLDVIAPIDLAHGTFPWRREDAVVRFHDGLNRIAHMREYERTRCFAAAFWALIAQTGVPIISADLGGNPPPPLTGSVAAAWEATITDLAVARRAPPSSAWVRLSSAAPSHCDVFVAKRGSGGARKVGWGPFGVDPTLRTHHLRMAKLVGETSVGSWDSASLTWVDPAVLDPDEAVLAPPEVPTWVHNDTRAVWQQTVTLTWCKAMCADLGAISPTMEDDVDALETVFWSSHHAWSSSSSIQLAHRLAHSDCDMRTHPTALTDIQLEDVRDFVRVCLPRWAALMRRWAGGGADAPVRWFVQPLRPMVDQLRRTLSVPPTTLPHIVLVRPSGVATALWANAASRRMCVHDTHRLVPLLLFGISAWSVIHEGERAVAEMVVADMAATSIATAPVDVRVHGMLASVIRCKRLLLPAFVPMVIVSDGSGARVWTPVSSSQELVSDMAPGSIARRGARNDGATLFITWGDGLSVQGVIDDLGAKDSTFRRVLDPVLHVVLTLLEDRIHAGELGMTLDEVIASDVWAAQVERVRAPGVLAAADAVTWNLFAQALPHDTATGCVLAHTLALEHGSYAILHDPDDDEAFMVPCDVLLAVDEVLATVSSLLRTVRARVPIVRMH